jgi:hypothetical protein
LDVQEYQSIEKKKKEDLEKNMKAHKESLEKQMQNGGVGKKRDNTMAPHEYQLNKKILENIGGSPQKSSQIGSRKH